VDVAHGPAPVVGEPVALKYKTGVIVAALLAAWLGLMALALANIASDANAGVQNALKLNPGIGPYGGKEVIWLTTWLLSWVILHFAFRNRDLNLKRWFTVFLVGVLVAVLLMWPPVFEAIADVITGG